MNLLKLLFTISFITLFSRILGFIRDIIIAQFFGSKIAADAFFIAFRLPNLLRRIFAEGAFSQVFVPILVEYKNQQGDKATRIFITYISGLLTLVLAIVTLIGIFSAPWIIYINAPGFYNTPKKLHLTILLLRIIFPYILLISLTSLIGSILNIWNRFHVPAFAPIFLNISMIISVLLLAPYCNPPIISLAYGVLFGGILQLIYQLPFLYKIGMLVLPRISFNNNDVFRVLKLMIPAIIGISAGQISLGINTIFASFLQSGSISWMYYADRLIEFPTGILGVGLSTILLPSLTLSFSNGNYVEYRRLINWGLKLCFLLALPCTVGLIILSGPLIISLFKYGNFTTYDVLMTKQALIAYSIGLIGLITIKVLVVGFYSRKDIKTPVKIAIIILILTQLMNLIFIKSLKHIGLELSVGLAACCHALLLYWQLCKQKVFIPLSNWKVFLFKIIIALIIMIIVLFLTLNFMPPWEYGNILMRIMRLLLVILIGVISYFVTLFFFGFRLQDFLK